MYEMRKRAIKIYGLNLYRKEGCPMEKERPMYVNVETVQHDFCVSRAKAYQIIRQLNEQLKEQHPKAIIVAGRVNRIWYEEVCLLKTGVN